jgi:hypothetical protein
VSQFRSIDFTAGEPQKTPITGELPLTLTADIAIPHCFPDLRIRSNRSSLLLLDNRALQTTQSFMKTN